MSFLAGKIIAGGNGNWGEKIMAGHPQHSLEETTEMARYILSLAAAPEKGLPLQGVLRPRPSAAGGAYLLAATYTDGGGNGIAPISASKLLVLRDATLQAEGYDMSEGVERRRWGADRKTGVLYRMKGLAHIGFTGLDMTGVASLTLRLVPQAGGIVTVRSGSADGKVLGTGNVIRGSKNEMIDLRIPLNTTEGKQDIYLVFTNKQQPEEEMPMLDWIRFEAEDRLP
jgi:cytochrome c